MNKVEKTGQSIISDSQSIKDIQSFMKSWKPTTKVEVVKMLNFLSVVNNATTVKKIKDACYSFLDNKCAECVNAIDPESGLEVVRVDVNKNVLVETEEIRQKKALIKLLQSELKELEEKAEVSHTQTSFYYKAKI